MQMQRSKKELFQKSWVFRVTHCVGWADRDGGLCPHIPCDLLKKVDQNF